MYHPKTRKGAQAEIPTYIDNTNRDKKVLPLSGRADITLSSRHSHAKHTKREAAIHRRFPCPTSFMKTDQGLKIRPIEITESVKANPSVLKVKKRSWGPTSVAQIRVSREPYGSAWPLDGVHSPGHKESPNDAQWALEHDNERLR